MDPNNEVYVYDRDYVYLSTMTIYQFCRLYKVDIKDIPIYLDKKYLIFNYFMIKTQYVSVIHPKVSDDAINDILKFENNEKNKRNDYENK